MDTALVLLKPRLLSTRNRWAHINNSRHRGQDIVLFSFSLFVAFTTYWGLSWTLRHLKSMPDFIYLPPALPLGLIFIFLMMLLCISSTVSALGSFYLAEDLDLVLSAPVSRVSLFFSKLMQITFSISWMPCTFLIPALIAFAQAYDAGWSFYLTCVVVFIPFFLIPVAFSIALGTIGMSLIDPRWIKAIVLAVIGTIIIGIGYIAKLVISIATQTDNNAVILHTVSFFGRASIWWSPSTWVTAVLAEGLHPIGINIGLRVLLLYSTALMFIAFSYCLVEVLHLRGVTRARNSRLSVHKYRRSNKSKSFSPSEAIMGKEWRALFRDVAQSTQILFLACLALLYLSNLTSFAGLSQSGEDGRWWQTLLFSLHSCITAFFTTAIGTRVVFSSVSLEGRQWWILQTSPISTKEILQAKFRFWITPIALVSGIIFALGAYVISGRLDVTIAHVALSVFTTYGLVGLGIGLGAGFADFEWEHPSQLALGVGGFVYMLCSVMLVMLNTVPLWFVLRLGSSPADLPPKQLIARLGAALLAVFAMAAINVFVARLALSLGEKSLKASKI